MEHVEPISWIEKTIHDLLRERSAAVPTYEWLRQTDADRLSDQALRLKVRSGNKAIELTEAPTWKIFGRSDPEFREDIRQRVATDIAEHLT